MDWKKTTKIKIIGVYDTHVWVWWLENPGKLSVKARKVLGRSQNAPFYLSDISLREVAQASKKGRLVFSVPLLDWLDSALSAPELQLVPLDARIAAESADLPDFHSDPADQMIVATARVLGATLITKDKRILKYAKVKTLW